MILFGQGAKTLKGIVEMVRDHLTADWSNMKTNKKGMQIEAGISSFPNQL